MYGILSVICFYSFSIPAGVVDKKATMLAEPNVYLEIDVKVNVDRGKCLLYTKDQHMKFSKYETEL